jgi:hypothetical protein
MTKQNIITNQTLKALALRYAQELDAYYIEKNNIYRFQKTTIRPQGIPSNSYVMYAIEGMLHDLGVFDKVHAVIKDLEAKGKIKVTKEIRD